MNVFSANTPSHAVDELAVSDDGRRGFALYQGSSKLSVLDLETQKLIDEVTTGRGGKKFAKFMGAFALSVAVTAASQSAAPNTYIGNYVLDGTTGKVRARHLDFKRAESVLVEEAPRKEEERRAVEPEPQPELVVEPR